MTGAEELAREFAEHRAVLVGAAYRVLGSVVDAEDVVQDAWLRWSAVEQRPASGPTRTHPAEVRDARAYLIRITTRLALNRLRQQKARREQYVGPWLPEPYPDESGDPAAAAELADSASIAMLVVLETLSPLERATFVLREVFDLPYDEIADTLGRSEAAVRQLAHRAREHVHARRPRQRVDKSRTSEVTLRFLAAAWSGDVDEAVSLLAPDVVLVTDGGGRRKAALRPIRGADKILRWIAGVAADNRHLRFGVLHLNGELAFAADDGDVLDTVGFVELSGTGRISTVYAIRNPDKLAALQPR